MTSRSRFLVIHVAALALWAGWPALVRAQQGQAELQSWRVPGWSFTPGVAIGTQAPVWMRPPLPNEHPIPGGW